MREPHNPSPLARQGYPLLRERGMTIGRERAALAAADMLKRMGADVRWTAFTPAGIPFIHPYTGRRHGPWATLERTTGVGWFVLTQDGLSRFVDFNS